MKRESAKATAVYYRYHNKYEEECDTLEAAINFLEGGEDDGDLSSRCIIYRGKEYSRHWSDNNYEDATAELNHLVEEFKKERLTVELSYKEAKDVLFCLGFMRRHDFSKNEELEKKFRWEEAPDPPPEP